VNDTMTPRKRGRPRKLRSPEEIAGAATARPEEFEAAQQAEAPPPRVDTALSPATLQRLQVAWLALESARQAHKEAHEASLQAAARVQRCRADIDALFRSIFERRPLFDALPDEECRP
jgi:hypothetical protein